MQPCTKRDSGARSVSRQNPLWMEKIRKLRVPGWWVEEVSGREVTFERGARRPGDPPQLVAAGEKAARELGWRPQFPDLRPIVASAWAWHEAHPQGYGEEPR